MPSSRALRLYFDLLWIALTLAVLGAFSAPLLLQDIAFPFWPTLIAFVTIFMLTIRYIFFLRHSWLASRQMLKVAAGMLGIWGIFLLVHQLHDFRTYADETGLQAIMGHLSDADYTALSQFTRNTMVFFGVGSILSTGVLVLRLIYSIWRWHNHQQA